MPGRVKAITIDASNGALMVLRRFIMGSETTFAYQ
jgi:hypothetical protein